MPKVWLHLDALIWQHSKHQFCSTHSPTGVPPATVTMTTQQKQQEFKSREHSGVFQSAGALPEASRPQPGIACAASTKLSPPSPGAMAPLHRAAARGHAPIVTTLLDHGASPLLRSAVGQTPLMYASQFGHRQAVAALLCHSCWRRAGGALQQGQAGAGRRQEGGSSREAAAGREGGSRNEVRGAHTALRAYVAEADAAGLTALHLAAQWGMVALVEDLIRGIQAQNFEESPPGGMAALSPQGSLAARSGEGVYAGGPGAGGGCPEDLGESAWNLADPNCRTSTPEGLTPAHLAARWGHQDVLWALHGLGADLGLPAGGSGRSPLLEALEWSRPCCVDTLRALLPAGSSQQGARDV